MKRYFLLILVWLFSSYARISAPTWLLVITTPYEKVSKYNLCLEHHVINSKVRFLRSLFWLIIVYCTRQGGVQSYYHVDALACAIKSNASTGPFSVIFFFTEAVINFNRESKDTACEMQTFIVDFECQKGHEEPKNT